MEIIADESEVAKTRDFIDELRSPGNHIIAHTSGSTGKAKRISLNKTDVMISAGETCRLFGIDSDSTLFLPLSIDYIAGKMMLARAETGNCRIIIEKPSNTPLSKDPGREITLAAIVPSQIFGLLDSRWVRYVRNIIVGGAPMSDEQEKALIESGIPSYATYGMTETCSHVALRPLGTRQFRALSHVSFSQDNRDCIVIHSDKMSFGKLVTNDIVTLVSDKEFIWRGRYDNVINSGGIKLFPEEIEKKLSPSMENRNFFITGRPNPKWGTEVVIAIEGENPVDNLSVILETCLSKFERPKTIIYMKEFRRTSSGKIIRSI